MAEKIIYYVLPTYNQAPSLNTNFTCDNVNYKGFLFSDSTTETGDLLLVYNQGWIENKYKYININNKTTWFIENNCTKPITCFIFKHTKNCTIDNSQVIIDSGESYSSTVTLAEGKTWEDLKSVVILMGGIDITFTAWDNVNHTINVSSVTGNLDMTINVGDIPAEYTEYEWLQSSGTQYIDTAYPVTSGLVYDLDFMLLTYTGGEHWITATYGGGYNVQCGTNNGSSFNVSIGITYTYEGSSIMNTKANAHFTVSGNSSRSFFIFAQNERSAYHLNHGSYKLYGYRIYNSSAELVLDLRPVVRNSDSKPGLFDVVTETFFTNSGTGEFTYGND